MGPFSEQLARFKIDKFKIIFNFEETYIIYNTANNPYT